MKLIFSLMVCTSLLMPAMTSAEYYQYKGADGTVRYTDNLAKVPAAQRSDVKRYQDEKSESSTPAALQPAKAAPVVKGEGGLKQTAAAANDRAKKAADVLEKEKSELDKTFNDLETERKELKDNPPGRNASIAELQAYDNKVYDLNRRIKEYETRCKAFRQKAKTFNAKTQK